MVRLAGFSPQFADRVPILVRLCGAHVVIIPGLILVLVILHGLLVKRHRISPHPSLPTDATGAQAPAEEPTEPFTHHLRRIANRPRWGADARGTDPGRRRTGPPTGGWRAKGTVDRSTEPCCRGT
jgi:hypothetical protein